jgi:hypothetical protein
MTIIQPHISQAARADAIVSRFIKLRFLRGSSQCLNFVRTEAKLVGIRRLGFVSETAMRGNMYTS